ncbi:MAG: VOC family protein [Acidimicrobiales bacterium]
MIRNLGYLRLTSPHVEEWRSFATEILGLMAVEGGDPGALYLRMDDRPPRLVITPGEASAIGAIGLEVADRRELEAVAGAVGAAGTAVKEGAAEDAAERRVEALIQFEDPHGLPVEVYFSPILDHRPLATPLVSGFVTGAMGMGHVVVAAPDLEASMAFWTGTLGFRHRDSMRVPMGPGKPMTIRFLGCNPRHHSVALMEAEYPGDLVHFMIEVASIDDVGMLLDRCADSGITLQASLGRHTNDRVLSTYLVGPGGVAVEVGTGGLRVDDATWTTQEITAVSFWGHKFVPGTTAKIKPKR